MRIIHTVNPQIWDDTSKKNALFVFDSTTAEIQTDSYSRMVSGKFSIDASTSEDIPFGDINAVYGAFLIFDGDCTLSINDSADTISIKLASDADSAKFFIEATLSKLTVTAGVDDLSGVFCLWGDLA